MTPTQRRILFAMSRDETGLAAFTGEGARKHGFAILDAKHGGIIVRVYGTPEYFLKQKGLIERADRNVPGNWYRLTENGRASLFPPRYPTAKAGEKIDTPPR